MEKHFLNDFVSGPSGVTPEPWYNPDGDCVIYQTTNEAVVADRIDEVLTIYRSFETGKSVGYQIKGVAAIIHLLGLVGIGVECEEKTKELTQISLYALLLAAYEKGPQTISRRNAYAAAFESCEGNARFHIEDLESALA